jgi:hypothetical protein
MKEGGKEFEFTWPVFCFSVFNHLRKSLPLCLNLTNGAKLGTGFEKIDPMIKSD